MNSGYWLFLNFASRGAGFVRSILVARFLSVEAASLGFLALSLGAASRAFLESGTTQIIVSEKRLSDRLVRASWTLELTKGALLGTVLLLGAAVASAIGFDAAHASVLALAALVPLSLGILHPIYRIWEREGRHGQVVAKTVIGTALGVVTMLTMFALGANWWAVPVSIAGGQVVTAILTHRAGGPPPRFSRRPFASSIWLFKKGLPFLSIGFSVYLSTLGIDVVLALFGAVAWIGPYRIGMALVHTVLSALPAVLARASLSEDAARVRSSSAGLSAHPGTVAVITAATVLMVPLCYTFLPQVALKLYGSDWSPVASIVPPLCVFVGFKSLSTPFTTALIAGQRYGTEARIQFMEALSCSLAIGALAEGDIRRGIWVAAGIALFALLARTQVLRHINPGASRVPELLSMLACTCLASQAAAMAIESIPAWGRAATGPIGAALLVLTTQYLRFRSER